jgi:hypothetical protein
MSLTRYERGTTFKTTGTFKSGTTLVDPVGNIANIDVYDSTGFLYISDSGTRDSTGTYHYYVSTSSTDDLGIYIIDWNGLIDYGAIFGNQPYHDRNCVWIDKVVQV